MRKPKHKMLEVCMRLPAPKVLRRHCTAKFSSLEYVYAGSVGQLGNGILLEVFNFLTITANLCWFISS